MPTSLPVKVDYQEEKRARAFQTDCRKKIATDIKDYRLRSRSRLNATISSKRWYRFHEKNEYEFDGTQEKYEKIIKTFRLALVVFLRNGG